jgi:hypothetical protein
MKRFPDSAPITIAYYENGRRWDHVPAPPILARNLLPEDLRRRF